MKKLIFILFILTQMNILGQNDNQRSSQFNLENKLALQGYDPVAYFKSNKAIKGKKEISYNYKNVIYYFSTKENLELFKKKSQYI